MYEPSEDNRVKSIKRINEKEVKDEREQILNVSNKENEVRDVDVGMLRDID